MFTVLAWQYNTALSVVLFALLLSYVCRCQLHEHTLVISKGPDYFCHFNQIRGFLNVFV